MWKEHYYACISNSSKLRLAFSYYTCLLHEATPTNHALMHEAYTFLCRCTFLVIVITYAAKGVVY